MTKNNIKIYLISSSKQLALILEERVKSEETITFEGFSFDFLGSLQSAKRKICNVLIIDTGIPVFDAEAMLKRVATDYPVAVIFLTGGGMAITVPKKEIPYDTVIKPVMLGDKDNSKQGNSGFLNELIVKIKILSTAKVEKSNIQTVEKSSGKIIAIGASTGGVEAIQHLLTGLPDNLPGIVIVQHIPPHFSRLFAERLNSSCKIKVKEAVDGEEVVSGTAIVAAGDKHMKIIKKGDKYVIKSFTGEKVSGHCPSVDVLFESVAEAAGTNAVGVILTGMGADGAKGMALMRKKGAYTIGQDEKTCVIYGMPMEAYKLGGVVKQLPLNSIIKEIIEKSK
jgi:two-component system, chemotaxis family, protein-glutamate methylesterase/glutaminase